MVNRKRVNEIVSVAAEGDTVSRAFDILIIALIVLNVVAMMLETVRSIGDTCPGVFLWFERISVAVFTAEYLARIWSCTATEAYRRPVIGRLRLAATPMMLVDLLAILPFYLPFLGIDLRFLRTLRITRIVRVAKLGRYSQSLQTLWRVLAAKRYELSIAIFVLVLLLVLSSSVLYFAENEAQPEAFSSIPATMWWAVTTLTTVGYGDISPVTPVGKLFASVVAILGIGMFALPTGILSAGFVDELRRRGAAPAAKCPHCGRSLDG